VARDDFKKKNHIVVVSFLIVAPCLLCWWHQMSTRSKSNPEDTKSSEHLSEDDHSDKDDDEKTIPTPLPLATKATKKAKLPILTKKSLSKCTLNELRQACRKKGIRGHSGKKKADLIDLMMKWKSDELKKKNARWKKRMLEKARKDALEKKEKKKQATKQPRKTPSSGSRPPRSPPPPPQTPSK
jgi:type IV secretory pathway VirB10-like protein